MATPRRDEKKQRERQAAAARRAAAKRQRTAKTLSIIGVIVIVAVLIGGAFQIADNGSTSSTTTTTAAAEPAPALGPDGKTPCPPPDGSAKRTITFSAPFTNCVEAGKSYTATFDTNQGKVVVALDTTKTPQTASNFIGLARYHYYDTTEIFRTDPSIDIIQGGSPHTNSASDEGPGYTINDEGNGYKYTEGDLVMARTGNVNSAGSQFFFATGPNVSALNSQGTYVTFGHATEGLDVLKKIIGMNVDTGTQLGGKPSSTVTVNKVTITES